MKQPLERKPSPLIGSGSHKRMREFVASLREHIFFFEDAPSKSFTTVRGRNERKEGCWNSMTVFLINLCSQDLRFSLQIKTLKPSLEEVTIDTHLG